MIPLLVLLGFAAWTLLVLLGSIGVYRWYRILAGTSSIVEWRADLQQGSDWYQRAMRAHMNCVENLPVYTALVGAIVATGLESPTIDALAAAILPARIGQTMVHVALPPSNAVNGLRFGLFSVQFAAMAAIGVIVAASLLGKYALPA